MVIDEMDYVAEQHDLAAELQDRFEEHLYYDLLDAAGVQKAIDSYYDNVKEYDRYDSI